MKKINSALKKIGREKGQGYAIKVANNMAGYRRIRGFSEYSAIFASVLALEAKADVLQEEAEKQTLNILHAAEIYSCKEKVLQNARMTWTILRCKKCRQAWLARH